MLSLHQCGSDRFVRQSDSADRSDSQTGRTGQTVARPLLQGQDKLTVWYGLRLIRLEVDEGSNVITTSVWVRQVCQTVRQDRQDRQLPDHCSMDRIN